MPIENSSQIFMRRLGIFLCFWLFGLLTTAVIIGVLGLKLDMNSAPVLRVMTVIQDILVFITPVAATAVLISRKPLAFLCLDHGIKVSVVGLMLVTLMVSIPMMNVIVEWNLSLSLPESMSSIEEWMRGSEERSAKMVETMLSGTSVKDLIVSILIVGVLTGLGEELFFRGMLQRILADRMNIHAAIWVTAIIFSAAHFQFYGFVPRMLLGGFFGYLAWWSRSLWLPVIAHAFNNSLVVAAQWSMSRGNAGFDPNKIGVGEGETGVLLASLLLTVAGIWTLYRMACRTAVNRESDKG